MNKSVIIQKLIQVGQMLERGELEYSGAEADTKHYLEQYSELRQPLVSGSLLSDVDYWKQRCLLAEQCLEESPCDPDITSDQIKAWNAYHKFISWAGNDS